MNNNLPMMSGDLPGDLAAVIAQAMQHAPSRGNAYQQVRDYHIQKPDGTTIDIHEVTRVLSWEYER